MMPNNLVKTFALIFMLMCHIINKQAIFALIFYNNLHKMQ
jgi:hypothetical protein